MLKHGADFALLRGQYPGRRNYAMSQRDSEACWTPEEEVEKLRSMLRWEFNTEKEQCSWPVDLWGVLLESAGDPDRAVLPSWMRCFPKNI